MCRLQQEGGMMRSNNRAKGMKELHKQKLQHAQASEILRLACKNLTFLSEKRKHRIAKALLTAAKLGNVEFFLKVSTANPELISIITFPQQKGHVFFKAAECCRAEIFELLRAFRFKNAVAAMLSENNNNLLLTAAKLGLVSHLNCIPCPVLQMQREYQWLKVRI